MSGQSGDNLIFLISQPRAGSTMLQLMLSGHADVATTPEPWIALHPLYALRDGGIYSEFDSSQARLALGDFLKHGGADIAFYREQVGIFLSALYNRAASHQGKPLFLDKTPRYYYIIDELMEVFPEAKFIILLRNPLAVLSSILKTWVKDDIRFLSYFGDDLVRAPRALADALDAHPGRCASVSYEDLVVRPEEILKELSAFIGIDFQDAMLDYGDRKSAEWKLGDPVGVHKASRPNPASAESWKKAFTTAQASHLAEEYLKELGPELIKRLGYDFKELKEAVEGAEAPSGTILSWEELMRGPETGFCEIETLKSEKEALMNSMSWKVTAPLRGALDLIKRRKGGGD